VSTATARIALVGNPNSGKTALFNALTGSHQKVANYAGVTVEKKEGTITTASGRTVSVLDLPGTYSLRARSPDEAVTRDAILGQLKGETPPRLAERLATSKAQVVASRRPQAVVLAADTVVAVGRRFLEKAADEAEAARFLKLLSGRNHRVFTGVAVVRDGRTAGSCSEPS